MGISIPFITGMVIVVGTIALLLLTLLTYQIYTSKEPKQRASVEPEVDNNNEIT